MNYKEILVQLGLTGVVTFTINLCITIYFYTFNVLPELYFIFYFNVALVTGTFLIFRGFTFLPETPRQNNDKVSSQWVGQLQTFYFLIWLCVACLCFQLFTVQYSFSKSNYITFLVWGLRIDFKKRTTFV